MKKTMIGKWMKGKSATFSTIAGESVTHAEVLRSHIGCGALVAACMCDNLYILFALLAVAAVCVFIKR